MVLLHGRAMTSNTISPITISTTFRSSPTERNKYATQEAIDGLLKPTAPAARRGSPTAKSASLQAAAKR